MKSGDILKNMAPKKIRIIGSVGSGKTTLARKLSSELDIPYYELDNVVWKRHKSGDTKRTEREREEHLNSIIQTEHWIIEGVHSEDWVSSSFHHAELIIFLDTQYQIRTYRMIKRFLKQKLGLEKSNYNPSWRIFFSMFKWNRDFENVEKIKFFNNYRALKGKIKITKSKNCIQNTLTK